MDKKNRLFKFSCAISFNLLISILDIMVIIVLDLF